MSGEAKWYTKHRFRVVAPKNLETVKAYAFGRLELCQMFSRKALFECARLN